MDQHKHTCDCRLVNCVNDCGQMVPLAHMDSHLLHECVAQVITCPLSTHGKCNAKCTGTMTRKTIAEHFRGANASNAFFLTAMENRSLSTKVQFFEEANKDLAAANTELIEQVKLLTKQVSQLQSGIRSQQMQQSSPDFKIKVTRFDASTSSNASPVLALVVPPSPDVAVIPGAPPTTNVHSALSPFSRQASRLSLSPQRRGSIVPFSSTSASPQLASPKFAELSDANPYQSELESTLQDLLSPDSEALPLNGSNISLTNSSGSVASPQSTKITLADCNLIRDWVLKESNPDVKDFCVCLLYKQLRTELPGATIRHIAFEFNWHELNAKGVKSVKSNDVFIGEDLIARVVVGKAIKTNDIRLCSYIFGYNEEYTVMTTICVFNKNTQDAAYTNRTVYNTKGNFKDKPLIPLQTFLNAHYISAKDNFVRILTTFVIPSL